MKRAVNIHTQGPGESGYDREIDRGHTFPNGLADERMPEINTARLSATLGTKRGFPWKYPYNHQ